MGGKLLVLRIFIIQFPLCLIFIKVWPIEVLVFEIRHLDKLHKPYDKFKYIHDTESVQFLQKHDGYNTIVIIENNVPSWQCDFKKKNMGQVSINYIYIYIYIHTTKSAEISQKQDEHKAL